MIGQALIMSSFNNIEKIMKNQKGDQIKRP
jgi:hypothetical protein